MNKKTYYISISQSNMFHILHNGTCKLLNEHMDDMIRLGEYEDLVIALSIARNNYKKVLPCSKCVLKHKHRNTDIEKKLPVPIRHLPE